MVKFKGILVVIILISFCALVVFAILWAIGFPIEEMPKILGILGAIAIAGLLGGLLQNGIDNLPKKFKKKADRVLGKILKYVVYAVYISICIGVLYAIVSFILMFFE